MKKKLRTKNGEETKKKHTCRLHMLIVQGLWQAHYQILLIILLKRFVKLNVIMDMIIKNVKRVELNTKIVNAILNI